MVVVVGGEGRERPSLGAVAMFICRRVCHGVDRGREYLLGWSTGQSWSG